MKHQLAIAWDAPESFALVIDQTQDGERIARNDAQREADCAVSAQKQLQMID